MKLKSLFRPIIQIWQRVYIQNVLVWIQIWTDRYPPDDPKEHRLLEKILLTPVLIGRCISLSNLAAVLSPGKARYWFIDLYVLSWVIILMTLLFLTSSGELIFALIAIYRIVDILTYQICVILIDSQKSDWKLGSIRSSFLSSLINLFEIVSAFAILYLTIGNIKNGDGDSLVGPLSSFYYSLVTMATLGYGEYFPNGQFSQGLVVAQIISELLFLVIFVPVFSANIVTQLQARELVKLEERKRNKNT